MHNPTRQIHRTLLACAMILAGCSSSGSKTGATGPSGSTGNLTVTITPADGSTPSVTITGPNSYSKRIAATQTLNGLPTGQYTVTADSALVADSVVGNIIDTASVSGSPVTLSSNNTSAVTATYARERRVGGLWIGNQGHSTIPELSSDQLRHSGSPTPADTLVTAVGGPAGLALDSQGNMWVSSIPIGQGDTIAMYTPAARNAGGTSAASRLLISTAINNAQTIAFDNSGNLWMANCGLSQLIKFSASQLSAGGTQTPSATVTTSPIVMCPYALAFDNSGDLWVTDGNLGTHIAKYAAAQLTSTGNPTPVDTVGSQSGSLSSPEGLAFDANGNLWVANDGAPTVVEYTPTQLAAQGAPTPHVTITIPGSEPRGIAFDKRGTLWVADDANAAVYGLTSGQIGLSGSPAPAIADTITLNGGLTPQQIVFDPFATAAGPSSARVRLPPPVAAAAVRRRH